MAPFLELAGQAIDPLEIEKKTRQVGLAKTAGDWAQTAYDAAEDAYQDYLDTQEDDFDLFDLTTWTWENVAQEVLEWGLNFIFAPFTGGYPVAGSTLFAAYEWNENINALENYESAISHIQDQ